MPVNPNSTMRKRRTCLFGWKEGERVFLSVEPRGAVRNEYETDLDALSEASKRHVPIKWLE